MKGVPVTTITCLKRNFPQVPYDAVLAGFTVFGNSLRSCNPHVHTYKYTEASMKMVKKFKSILIKKVNNPCKPPKKGFQQVCREIIPDFKWEYFRCAVKILLHSIKIL